MKNGMFTLIFCLICTISFSQHSLDSISKTDYKFTINYSGFFDDNFCNCSQARNLYISNGGYMLTPLEWKGLYLGVSGQVSFNAGPGYSKPNVFISAVYEGTKRKPGCLDCAGGLCSPDVCFENVNFSPNSDLSTDSIYNPTNVLATNGDFTDKIVITWEKGTDIPDSLHSYRIYRNNVLIVTVPGDSLNTYADTSALQPGQTYTYKVTTYATTSVWGEHESPGVSDQGSLFAVVASKGAFSNRVNLTWSDISHIATDIRVERSILNSTNKEELAILNKSAKSYNDQNGVPGYKYKYYITSISSPTDSLTVSDSGYTKPNGNIKGYVRSSFGIGVSGVEVKLYATAFIPGGGAIPPICQDSSVYCAITNSEGYYEIRDIYYYTGAEYKIVPSKTTNGIPHKFSPVETKRFFDENIRTHSGVDFIDESVYSVGGRVTYPGHNGDTCGVSDVLILINDENYGIKTDENGEWNFAISEEDTFSFKPQFKHHVFEDPDGSEVSQFFIDKNKLDINFENITTDSLRIIVQGGCQASLADSIIVTLSSPDGCYYEEITLDSSGYLLLQERPAMEYRVEVIELHQNGNNNLTNIFNQIGEKPIEINLIVRDTTTTYVERDSIVVTPEEVREINGITIIIPEFTTIYKITDTITGPVFPEVKFIYRSPLIIEIDWADAGAELFVCGSEPDALDLVIMEQGEYYLLPIEVTESLGNNCPVNEGELRIYDFVSDMGSSPTVVKIENGIANYPVIAGEPNVDGSTTNKYEKLIYIIPEVDLAPKTGVDFWVVVEGQKTNAPSFVTRSPDIPFLILHDPPGDHSFSYVEEGTTFKTFIQNEVLVGGEGGIYADVIIGAGTPASKIGGKVQLSAVAGEDKFGRNGLETSITFTERYETSSDPNLVGHAGDLYIGAAFNQGYSIAEQLNVNRGSCDFDLQLVPALSIDSFATTFVYTEAHIKNTLIPTFGKLAKEMRNGKTDDQLTDNEKKEINLLRRDSIDWENTLARNAENRDSLALFYEREPNLSFSAGATLSREVSIDSNQTYSFESSVFFNTDFALSVNIENEVGLWVESETGIMGKYRYSVNNNEGSDTTRTRTTGFVLSDDNIGDFFSVDILQDVAYSVPAFRTRAGTSSCPQEPGTQARDRPKIEIYPPDVSNVPADGAAQFVAHLINESESFETREYAVRVITTTNPDGAMVSLGSESINNFPQQYFLQRGDAATVAMTVEKGPLASEYERIGIMIYPECEYELWQNNGNLINADTAWITVRFQTECSNVSIAAPDDGWLINKNSDDSLKVTISGYDLNNENIESISIQIKREGQGYQTEIPILRNDLIGPFYDAYLNMTNFQDGEYRIRAKVNCKSPYGHTYSSELFGLIDRSSLAPFGTPSPSDGFLQEGQEVSVSFDKEINCDLESYGYDISLMRMDDSTMIDIEAVQCFGNKLIIVTDPPLLEVPDLENVRVEAYVHHIEDLAGNSQKYPVKWSFLVNTRPVFWDPSEVYQTTTVGTPVRIKGVLKNNARLSKAFTLEPADAPGIVQYPYWLTPVQKRGTILSNNSYEVEFLPDADLFPGIYTGKVIAAVGGQPIELDVTYEVLAHPVNWKFDSEKYENSMNLVLQFSLTQANTPLSSDTRDAIAAFVNGEIRGIANIEYLPELDKYAAFMTVYSNSTGSGGAEIINYRFWKALSGIEYGAVEIDTFVPNGTKGNPISPKILHPAGIFQVIPLNKGWNWVSFNVSTSDLSREKTFQSLIYPDASNTITVKSQTSTTIYSPGSGWSGNLRDMLLGPGYMVHLSDHGDTLRTVGNPSTDPVGITVGNTWNWIGFPEQAAREVDSVLVDLSPQVGQILKSQHAFAQFTQNNGWLGNLTMFEPGKSYRLRYHTAGTLNFRNEGTYQVPRGEFEFNMNITCALDPEKLNNANYRDLLVGAFIDDKCYGFAEVEYIPAMNEYRALLLVSGNLEQMDQPLTFKVLNSKTGKEYFGNGDKVIYAPDAIRGTILKPYQLFTDAFEIELEEDYALMQNRPNPASDITQIEFRIPIDTRVQIHLYDVNGTLLKTIADYDAKAGMSSVELNVSDLRPGVYIYRFVSEAFSATKKLTKH